MKLAIVQIRRDGGTQAREELCAAAVTAYSDSMLAGEEFPPVTVFYDGVEYWLADGFHRVDGASAAGCAEIEADVRQGTRRDAVLFSVGANARHGVRRTNGDKRRAVELLLSDEEWAKWPQGRIAEACGVSREFVSRVSSAQRARGEAMCDRSHIVRGDGRSYTVAPMCDQTRSSHTSSAAAMCDQTRSGHTSPTPDHRSDVADAARLERSLVGLTDEICRASSRARMALTPALDDCLRRLERARVEAA